MENYRERECIGSLVVYLVAYLGLSLFASVRLFWETWVGTLTFMVVSISFLVIMIILMAIFYPILGNAAIAGAVLVICIIPIGIAWGTLFFYSAYVNDAGFPLLYVWLSLTFLAFGFLIHTYLKALHFVGMDKMKAKVEEKIMKGGGVMQFRYKHITYPAKIIVDTDTPKDAKTILIQVVRSPHLWAKL